MSIKVRELLKGKRVVLASASPRRRELIKTLAEDFEVMPAQGEECAPEGTDVFEIAEVLAEQKCSEVVSRCEPDGDTVVIGCDTLVVAPDMSPMGKPSDAEDALDMLTALQDNESYVVSGVCVYFRGNYRSFSEITKVRFYPAEREELVSYIATGEPMDKAGAYAIQGLGGLLVKSIDGDYNNVVGMPVSRLARELSAILGG